MAGNLQQRLDRLKSKTEMVLARNQALQERLNAAKTHLSLLEETIRSKDREIGILRQQIEHLKVVNTLTPDHRDVEQTRAFLSGLLRDIDKCISELSE